MAIKLYHYAFLMNPSSYESLYLKARLLHQNGLKQKNRLILREALETYNKAYGKNPYDLRIELMQLEIQNILYNKSLTIGLKKLHTKYPNNYGIARVLIEENINNWDNISGDDHTMTLALIKKLITESFHSHASLIPVFYDKILPSTQQIEQIIPDRFGQYPEFVSALAKSDVMIDYMQLKTIILKKEEKLDPQKFKKQCLFKMSDEIKIKNEWIEKFGSPKSFLSSDEFIGKFQKSKKTMNNGKMFWNGAIYGVLLLPENGKLLIKASGTIARNITPYLIVSINGKMIKGAYLTNDQLQTIIVHYQSVDRNPALIAISFENDAENKQLKEDRNLLIHEVSVEKAL